MITIQPFRSCLPATDVTTFSTYARLLPKEQIRLPLDVLQDTIRQQWFSNSSQKPLFTIISIETRTGCNFTCSFCPVAKGIDPRPESQLTWEELKYLAAQLSVLQFDGVIAFFCNNEPLLDTRLAAIIEHFRAACPLARLKVLTNGLLVTVEKVHVLFRSGLSVLQIDNYTDGQKLTKNVKHLLSAQRELVSYDIQILMRKRDEVLTNRAGTSPNAEPLLEPLQMFCALPFTDININARGEIILCCQDALGKVVVADIRKSTLLEAWFSQTFRQVRKSLMRQLRAEISLCSLCDYDGYRSPPDKPNYLPTELTKTACDPGNGKGSLYENRPT